MNARDEPAETTLPAVAEFVARARIIAGEIDDLIDDLKRLISEQEKDE